MIKKNTIPTILGMIILIAGTFFGVFLLNSKQFFRLGASSDAQPKDVRVSNIDEGGFTISWTTDRAVAGFLVWGESASSTDKVQKEDIQDSKFFTHSITLSGLKPATTYYYKINSDSVTFDNNGVPWQAGTGPAIGVNKNSQIISGTVTNASGSPTQKALVYADVGGYLLSTTTSGAGNFVIQLGATRTQDLGSYLDINPGQTLIQISVQAPPDQPASAQIYPQSANPIPPLILGKVSDFRSLPANASGGNPNAQLNLPANASSESKFNVPSNLQTPSPTTVILDNLTEGETVSTTKPQFMGKGPVGTALTIEIHSQDPITQNVQVGSTGNWSFTPSSDLTPGSHTITVLWKDATGITRSLSRTFVVQAAELPAFTASQSGSTASPTPLATPVVSPTPISTLSATLAPIPVTGSLTPTILLSIMGVAVSVFSFFLWKMSEG